MIFSTSQQLHNFNIFVQGAILPLPFATLSLLLFPFARSGGGFLLAGSGLAGEALGRTGLLTRFRRRGFTPTGRAAAG